MFGNIHNYYIVFFLEWNSQKSPQPLTPNPPPPTPPKLPSPLTSPSSSIQSSADKASDFGSALCTGGGRSRYNGGIIQDHYPLYTSDYRYRHYTAPCQAPYNIYTGETILPPHRTPPVWVVIEADTANLSSVHHNMLAIPHVCYFVSVPPSANQNV